MGTGEQGVWQILSDPEKPSYVRDAIFTIRHGAGFTPVLTDARAFFSGQAAQELRSPDQVFPELF